MNVGTTIKIAREKVGISKSELSRRINVSPAYITMLENGTKKNPTTDILKKIANVLDISLSQLTRVETQVLGVGPEGDLITKDDPKLKVISEEFTFNQKFGKELKMPYTVENYRKDETRYFIDSFIGYLDINPDAIKTVLFNLDENRLENIKEYIENLLQQYNDIENFNNDIK